jgi:class 3 adenylate cyclase
MLALYRAGRQAEALEQYRALRTTLSDELGLEPDASLRHLQTAILRQSGHLEAAAPAAVLFAILTPSESDPATVRDLLERAAEAATAELRERGATVELGLAGALLARLDADAARALAAAAAVRDRLEAELGGSVRARIGVELGDVLGGKGGLSGLPVATAARLAGSAQPGEILVGPEAAAARQSDEMPGAT